MGFLGDDPTVSTTSNNNKVANVWLATNEKYKSNGEDAVKTTWHNLVYWNKKAELAEKHLKKGSHVDITGRIQQKEWTDKNGVQRYDKVVVVDQINFLDRRDSEADRRRSVRQPQGDAAYIVDGDETFVPDPGDEFVENDIPM